MFYLLKSIITIVERESSRIITFMDFIYLRSQDNRSIKGFRSPSYHVPTHRIVRVVKGDGEYIFPDSTLKVKPGDVFLTSPGVRSIDFPGSQEVHIQVVNFSAPDYWMEKSHVLFHDSDRLLRFLNEIMDDMMVGKEKRRGILVNLAIDLFVECGEVDSGGNRVIQDVAEYILTNPHLNYTVSELAAQSGCSESHFRALFRKEMNMSPKAYIKKCKMDYAVRLMRDENLLVKEVADILGYNDIYEFSKQFKTVFGKPPTKLIKRRPVVIHKGEAPE